MAREPISYGLVLYPQFEVLDIAGPLEALNWLSRDHADIKLSVIAKDLKPVGPGPISPDQTSVNFAGQQWYLQTHTFETAPALDVLIVPGGFGSVRGDNDPQDVIDFIRKAYQGSGSERLPLQYIFSISGILDGHRATTNKAAWSMITPAGTKTHWVAKGRWVVSDNIWTTSGVSGGTDGMIAFLKTIYGDKEVASIVNNMEYNAIEDSGNDIFADIHGVVDVEPVAG